MRLWRLGKSHTVQGPSLTTCHHLPIKEAPQDRAGNISDIHKKFIHLFRALLRQCTYLPDPAARSYMKIHVISRFRDYHPRSKLSVARQRGKSAKVVEQRRPYLLKAARKGLLYLQRANDGHPIHLGKVLSMSYGRLGKRRHQLLGPLKIPDVPTDKVALAELTDPRFQEVPRPSQQLLALISSQTRRKQVDFPSLNKPTLAPQIPDKNSWGRPMPVKRLRNFKRRWYAQTLDRVMPPLPETEWEKLRRLASGEQEWDGCVPRRGQLATVGYKKGIVRGEGHLSSPHNITRRYMRRIWTKLFAQCPVMRPNPMVKMGWEVKWGDVKVEKNLVLKPAARVSVDIIAMFAGVDERGKLVRSLPLVRDGHTLDNEADCVVP